MTKSGEINFFFYIFFWTLYRGVNKGLFVLLNRTQAGPGRTVKQEQEDISRNHVQTFIYPSVHRLVSGQFAFNDFKSCRRTQKQFTCVPFLFQGSSIIPRSCSPSHQISEGKWRGWWETNARSLPGSTRNTSLR